MKHRFNRKWVIVSCFVLGMTGSSSFAANENIKKTYGNRLKHFCKMKEVGDDEVHSVKEKLNTFKSFILID